MFLVILIYFFIPAYGISPLVKTDDGELLGTTYTLPNGRVLEAFLGIPFAEPPIGINRFEPPKPKKYWNGTWDATYARSPCVQFFFVEGINRRVGEEDCLYLNLFKPMNDEQTKNRNNLMNVMVYIHGGAFMFGSGRIYPDYILQDTDIVFVSISYRVGPLGFFAANDLIAPGNNGLKDQVTALKWVQKNIRFFGGDPGKVTIYGPSSGAASVHYHLLSPLSEGLFEKAISASGSVLTPWSLLPEVLKNSIKLASMLKCPTADVRFMMRCLKNKSTTEILQATKQFSKSTRFITIPFSPVVEPRSRLAFLSRNPLNLLKSRKVKQIPWMVSVVEREGTATGLGFVDDKKILKDLNDKWNDYAPYVFLFDYIRSKPEKDHISSVLRKFYFKDKVISSQTEKELLQAFGDRLFYTRMIEAVKLHASAVYENTTYCYKFYYRGTESMCDYLSYNRRNYACHMDDQFYLVNFMGSRVRRSKLDNQISNFLVSSIIAFMKSGNPNTGAVKWKPIAKGGDMRCLSIYSPRFQRMENIEDKKTFRLWSHLLPSEYRESPE